MKLNCRVHKTSRAIASMMLGAILLIMLPVTGEARRGGRGAQMPIKRDGRYNIADMNPAQMEKAARQVSDAPRRVAE